MIYKYIFLITLVVLLSCNNISDKNSVTEQEAQDKIAIENENQGKDQKLNLWEKLNINGNINKEKIEKLKVISMTYEQKKALILRNNSINKENITNWRTEKYKAYKNVLTLSEYQIFIDITENHFKIK